MLTAAATKTKPIGDCDDRRFTIIVNSVSIAAPIGLPPKMAEFCHTSNRSLLGRQRCRALLRLYFISSATGRSPVGNEGCRALGGSLQKDNIFYWREAGGHHRPANILGFFGAKKKTSSFLSRALPTTARQAFWAFLAGSQKLAFLFPPSQTETPHT
jgi:hypothetical protein